MIFSILMQFAVIHTPLNDLFSTVSLGVIDWVIVFLVSSSVLLVDEIVKLFKRFKYFKKNR